MHKQLNDNFISIVMCIKFNIDLPSVWVLHTDKRIQHTNRFQIRDIMLKATWEEYMIWQIELCRKMASQLFGPNTLKSLQQLRAIIVTLRNVTSPTALILKKVREWMRTLSEKLRFENSLPASFCEYMPKHTHPKPITILEQPIVRVVWEELLFTSYTVWIIPVTEKTQARIKVIACKNTERQDTRVCPLSLIPRILTRAFHTQSGSLRDMGNFFSSVEFKRWENPCLELFPNFW